MVRPGRVTAFTQRAHGAMDAPVKPGHDGKMAPALRPPPHAMPKPPSTGMIAPVT